MALFSGLLSSPLIWRIWQRIYALKLTLHMKHWNATFYGRKLAEVGKARIIIQVQDGPGNTDLMSAISHEVVVLPVKYRRATYSTVHKTVNEISTGMFVSHVIHQKNGSGDLAPNFQ